MSRRLLLFGSKKPPGLEAKSAKIKALFSLNPTMFSPAKLTPTHAPAVPCCHALCFRWVLHALSRTAVFLRVGEEQKQTAGHERRTSKKKRL